jgi:hypothetical protein
MLDYARLCITLHNHTASAARVKRCAKIIAEDFQRDRLLQRRTARKKILPEICRREGYNPSRL